MGGDETIVAKLDIIDIHEMLLIDVFNEPLKNLDIAMNRDVDVLRLAFIIQVFFKIAHIVLD